MVFIFLAEGYEDIEAVSVIDILRRADVTVNVVSIHDKLEVKSAHGLTIVCDSLLKDIDLQFADMLVLPGGMPGTRNLGKSDELIKLLQKAQKEDKYIAAICAAPIVLAQAGVLKGKKAICYPGFETELTDAIIHDDLVVRDGKVITSKGPGTAMLFGYALVDILKGNLESDAIRKAMIFDWWHN